MALACCYCGFLASTAAEVCPSCSGFRTIVAVEDRAPRDRAAPTPSDGPVHASRIARGSSPRVSSGFDAFDRVLSGGVPLPSSIVLYGPPGARKTTHAARIAEAVAIARGGEALYLTPEMPAADVARAAARLGPPLRASWIWQESDLERCNKEIAKRRPVAIVYDSIQRFTVHRERGTDRAIDEVMWTAKEHVRTLGAVAILISRVTKGGDPLGPNDIIHDADIVLRLTPKTIACPSKNRHGPTPREAKLAATKKPKKKKRRTDARAERRDLTDPDTPD